MAVGQFDAERLGDGSVRVREQVEGEALALGELAMALDAIGRDAVHRDAVLLVALGLVLELSGFGGTARRLRGEVHYCRRRKVESDPLAVLVVGDDARDGLAGNECHLSSPGCPSRCHRPWLSAV